MAHIWDQKTSVGGYKGRRSREKLERPDGKAGKKKDVKVKQIETVVFVPEGLSH